MEKVTFKGSNVRVKEPIPKISDRAPSFTLVNQNLEDVTLDTFGSKRKLLNVFPSMDTSVCALSVKAFYKELQSVDDIVVLNISMDLPFAAKRFCQENNLNKAVTLSAFRSSFPDDYGVIMIDGPLKGLCARVVLLLDGSNHVMYREVVPEITQEPNYQLALKSILG